MHEFLTEETPVKVMSLLGAALISMGFLFGVTTANASFSGVEQQIPDPLPQAQIMAVVDRVAASYDSFLTANLFNPMRDTVAVHMDSMEQTASDFTDYLAMHVDVQNTEAVSPAPSFAEAATPRVAGAYTERAQTENHNGLLNVLISLVTK